MSEATFKKFPSLTNRNQEWLDKYVLPVYSEEPCYVTEKIHGANLTIQYDGEGFLWGRRNAWLLPDEKFYGLEYIKDILEERISRMYTSIKEVLHEHHMAAQAAELAGEVAHYPDIPYDFTSITLRGEFFGGGYSHPEVPKVKGMGQIQGGISYSQEKSFTTFRIEIDGKAVDISTMGMLCLSYNIPHVPILFMGTLQECLDWSAEHNEDNSVIPFGFPLLTEEGVPVPCGAKGYKSLPEFAKGENSREGHVIAPKTPIYLSNGSALIIKDKNDKWKETRPTKGPKVAPKDLEGSAAALLSNLQDYLSINRFSNVRSKEGPFKLKDLRKAAGLVIQDAIEDLCTTDEWVAWDSLNKDERKEIHKRLQSVCIALIKDEFFATAEV